MYRSGCRWRGKELCCFVEKFLLVCTLVATFASLAVAGSVPESPAPPGVIFELLVLNNDIPTQKKPKYLSPTEMRSSPDGEFLYIAQQTAKRIDVVDVDLQRVISRIRMPNEVTGIAVASGGGLLYATCSSDLWPAGKVCVVDLAVGRVVRSFEVGNGARAPVLTPDERRLYVCNRFDHTVSEVDLAVGREVKKIRAVREPFCAAMTSDGKTLIVGNLLPDGTATDTVSRTSKVTLINVDKGSVEVDIPIDQDRWGGRISHNITGVAVSYDDKFAFVTNINKIKALHPISTVERGWAHKNALAVIDIEKKEMVNQVCLDIVSSGMGDPWSVRCTKDGSFLVVSHAGANMLSIIDYRGFIDTLLTKTERGENMLNDFTSMLNTRVRVQLTVQCPRTFAIAGNKIYVAGYFSDAPAAIDICDLSLSATRPSGSISLEQDIPPTVRRKGEALFHDAALCFHKWQTCNSCHPLSRSDGQNWVLGGGVVIAPKNTKSLLYSWWTPPTMWNGRRGTPHQAIAAGIELELFRPAADSLTVPLDSFLISLKPASSPALVKGRLSEAARRGKALFCSEKAQCAGCHTPPLFTDNKFHTTGIPDPFEASVEWNTPSLTEAWRTGPYGHLGSFETVHEIIRHPDHNKNSSSLSDAEVDDIAEFVLSL